MEKCYVLVDLVASLPGLSVGCKTSRTAKITDKNGLTHPTINWNRLKWSVCFGLSSSSTQHAQRWVLARRFVTQWVFSIVACKCIWLDPRKTSIQILDLKGLVNRKFETHWVLLSYSYLGAFTFLWKKHPVTYEYLPDVRMNFALPIKGIWGFPVSSKRVPGKFFQGVEKNNATWRYLCGSHECDEYLMISHAYRHSNAFFLFQ